jgi:hypothetical protein
MIHVKPISRPIPLRATLRLSPPPPEPKEPPHNAIEAYVSLGFGVALGFGLFLTIVIQNAANGKSEAR